MMMFQLPTVSWSTTTWWSSTRWWTSPRSVWWGTSGGRPSTWSWSLRVKSTSQTTVVIRVKYRAAGTAPQAKTRGRAAGPRPAPPRRARPGPAAATTARWVRGATAAGEQLGAAAAVAVVSTVPCPPAPRALPASVPSQQSTCHQTRVITRATYQPPPSCHTSSLFRPPLSTPWARPRPVLLWPHRTTPPRPRPVPRPPPSLSTTRPSRPRQHNTVHLSTKPYQPMRLWPRVSPVWSTPTATTTPPSRPPPQLPPAQLLATPAPAPAEPRHLPLVPPTGQWQLRPHPSHSQGHDGVQGAARPRVAQCLPPTSAICVTQWAWSCDQMITCQDFWSQQNVFDPNKMFLVSADVMWSFQTVSFFSAIFIICKFFMDLLKTRRQILFKYWPCPLPVLCHDHREDHHPRRRDLLQLGGIYVDAKKSDPSDEGGFDIQYNGISEKKLPN